jgi:hypothetical protein
MARVAWPIACLLLLLASLAAGERGTEVVDVLVLNANPGGIGAAIAAADGGRNKVWVMEPLKVR